MRTRSPAATSQRTPEVEERILELLSYGRGLHGISQELGIPRTTIRHWTEADRGFAERVKIARAHGYEHWAEEIITIAAAAAVPNKSIAEVNAARLEVDSRKWLLGKLNPDRYGDHIQLTGKDGKDLIPPHAEAHIPRLLQVLAVLLPASSNSELFSLATQMARKLEPPQDGDGDVKRIEAERQTNGSGRR